MKRLHIFALLFVFMFSMIATACGTSNQATPQQGQQTQGTTFQVGIIPAEAKLGQGGTDKLSKYLGDKIGKQVSVKEYPDYNAVVEALNAGKLEMAYLGPLTYVIAHYKGGAKPVVARTTNGGKSYYYSYIIVPADSKLNSIDDLVKNAKDVKFAFGDPSSTSGSLVPGIALKEQGVYTDKNNYKFKSVQFTGSHDVTAKAVAAKQVDAGAIDSAYFDKLIADGKIKKDDYKIIWKSKELFQYPFAVNKDVSDDIVKKLQDAFVNLKDKDVLDAFAADGFVVTTDSDYEAIRKAAEADGRLK